MVSRSEPLSAVELRETLDLLAQHLLATDPDWVARSVEAILRFDAERSGRAPPVWDRERERPLAYIARMEAAVNDPKNVIKPGDTDPEGDGVPSGPYGTPTGPEVDPEMIAPPPPPDRPQAEEIEQNAPEDQTP